MTSLSDLPAKVKPPMTLNEACCTLRYYLQELEDNHTSVLNLLINDYCETDADKKQARSNYNKALNTLRSFEERGVAVIELDNTNWEMGANIEFRARAVEKDVTNG